MSEWKTLKQESIDVGGNNFVEVSLKQPPQSENVLIGISKGWYGPEEQKRYKANILFSREKKDELIRLIEEIDS